MSPWPHLVELDRAEDVNAFGEELLDVAEQVGVHGGAGDGDTRRVRDTGTVKYLRKPGDVGAGTQGLSGDTGMGTQRWSEDAGTVRRYWDRLGTQRQGNMRMGGGCGDSQGTGGWSRTWRDEAIVGRKAHGDHQGILGQSGEHGDGWDIWGYWEYWDSLGT